MKLHTRRPCKGGCSLPVSESSMYSYGYEWHEPGSGESRVVGMIHAKSGSTMAAAGRRVLVGFVPTSFKLSVWEIRIVSRASE